MSNLEKPVSVRVISAVLLVVVLLFMPKILALYNPENSLFRMIITEPYWYFYMAFIIIIVFVIETALIRKNKKTE